LIDVLIGFYLATLITELFTTRLYRLLGWYALNSLFLGLIALVMGANLGDKAMIISGSLTIIIKFLLIPYILKTISAKFKIPRNITPNLKVHYSTILVPIILVFTFYLVNPIVNSFSYNANYVAISISSLFLAILLIIEHKNIAPKIIGFLSIENALFLLAISATNGMPMLVELGIFVDVLMMIVIVNILFKHQGDF